MKLLFVRCVPLSKNVPNNHRNEKNEPFGDLLRTMNDFFQERPVKGILQNIDEFFSRPLLAASFPINVKETKTEHVISAELPGINKEQINISILENTVIISIYHEEMITEENSQQQIISKKQSSSQQSRSVSLPYLINERKVTASYKNGLLQIRVPKEKGKTIDID